MKLTIEGTIPEIFSTTRRIGGQLVDTNLQPVDEYGFKIQNPIGNAALVEAAVDVVTLVNGRESYDIRKLWKRVDALNAALPHPLLYRVRENMPTDAKTVDNNPLESAARAAVEHLKSLEGVFGVNELRNALEALACALPERAKEGEVGA